MTAEISIMNKSAVALAADSAVSARTTAGFKVFNTANKLFKLSNLYPVGIMLYGNSDFMGVPWETIIKEYRNALGSENKEYLEEFAQDLLNFLTSDSQLITEDQQESYFLSNVGGYYQLIKEKIIETCKERLQKEKKIGKRKIGYLSCQVINETYSFLIQHDQLEDVPVSHSKIIINKYATLIDKSISSIFEKLPIFKKDKKILVKIAGELCCRDLFSEFFSGIVVAGFGERDLFPKLQSYKIEAITCGKLKYKKEGETFMDFEKGSTIIPFAQGEMVHTFMRGVDPNLQTVINSYVNDILKKYPNIIVNELKKSKLDPSKRKEIKEKIKKYSNDLMGDYSKSLQKHIDNEFIQPVMSVVGMLPKDELAAMAESLVNLTSFKQTVSIGAETVGGPIDVAVISKGDGFVWIKRKNYFDIEKNPNYYDVRRRKEAIDEKRQKKAAKNYNIK